MRGHAEPRRRIHFGGDQEGGERDGRGEQAQGEEQDPLLRFDRGQRIRVEERHRKHPEHRGSSELRDHQPIPAHLQGESAGKGSTGSGQDHPDQVRPTPRHRSPTPSSPSQANQDPGPDQGNDQTGNRSGVEPLTLDEEVGGGSGRDRDQGDEQPTDVDRELFEPEGEEGVWYDQGDRAKDDASRPVASLEPTEAGPEGDEEQQRGRHRSAWALRQRAKRALVRTARVRTAAEPHPRIALTIGVHGFMRRTLKAVWG